MHAILCIPDILSCFRPHVNFVDYCAFFTLVSFYCSKLLFLVKEEALKKYNQKLSQALVQASQLLYSEKCINEETLDEMENLEGTTEDKKTTLLKAIDESLSPSYEKLGKITSVMSRFKETKYLYEKITAQYGKN